MTSLEDKAQRIIKNNSRGDFTVPCSNLYPFQWNWDSAFSALGIYYYNKERAIREIDMLFKGQWDNGMIPQIIFHKPNPDYYPGPDVWESGSVPATSCITQPPVISSVIWNLVLHGFDDRTKLREWFYKLYKYHLWFCNNRDPHNNGLISIFHPWETGRDNSPEWDEALENIPVNRQLDIPRKDNSHIDDDMRPTDDDYNRYMQIVYDCKKKKWNNLQVYESGLFNVCDPGVQFIFIKACKDLYKISIFLHEDTYQNILERWIYIYEAGCDKLWDFDNKSYTTLDIKTNKLYSGVSCASMLYAYAGVGSVTQKEAMKIHSNRILKHSTYGFPSWDPTSIEFDQKKYWRGPVWCIINYLLCLGFTNIQEYELAKKIKTTTIELIDTNGFFEYFDPLNGKGYGGNNFSWTAAMYLVLKNDNQLPT